MADTRTAKRIEIDTLTKEKLIESLRSAKYNLAGNTLGQSYFDSCLEIIAEHLIANGVTFDEDTNVPSKWIPVTERLPEHGDDVLCYTVYQDVEMLQWDENKKCWLGEYDYTKEKITHWLPLPQPPKEG